MPNHFFEFTEAQYTSLVTALTKSLGQSNAVLGGLNLLEQSVQNTKDNLKLIRSTVESVVLAAQAGEATVPPDVPPAVDFFEGEPFMKGGHYAWLPDSYRLTDAPEWMKGLAGVTTLADGSIELHVDHPALEKQGPGSLIPRDNFKSTTKFILPAAASNRSILCTSDVYPHGEHGPTWLLRNFEVAGDLNNLLAWRVGDFHAGREGHLGYFNVRGNLHVKNLVGIQHGAQLLQLVWRTTHEGETGTWQDPTKWPENQEHPVQITLENLVSIDGGVINAREGVPVSAVRASWPITIFNPGHKHVHVTGVYVRCNHGVPFPDSHGVMRNSHGVLVAVPQTRYIKGGTLDIEGIDAVVCNPDRSLMRFGYWDEVVLHDSKRLAQMDANGKETVGRIAVENDVDKFIIEPTFNWTGEVVVYDHNDPYKGQLKVLQHKAGERTELHPSEVVA
jgi:hypothetical protein